MQEIFNKTVHHMRSQGNPWGDHTRRGWTYVNPDDPCQRCAKGIHMDVEMVNGKYTADWIGYVSKFPDEIRNFLHRLEIIFEHVPCPYWEEHFERVAKLYSLKVPELIATRHEDLINE